MSWMRLAAAALGIATVVLTQVFVADPGAAHDTLTGLGAALVTWTINWPGTVSITENIR